MLEYLQRVFTRDLTAIRTELRAYSAEDVIWSCPPAITNSAGTLALHLTGNLQHFIGAQLGGSGYVRNRAAEFADRDVPLSELEARVDRTIEVVRKTLGEMSAQQLSMPYPLEFNGRQLPTGMFLLHLATHLAYHLGQIDYHRRTMTGDDRGVGVQSIPDLLDG